MKKKKAKKIPKPIIAPNGKITVKEKAISKPKAIKPKPKPKATKATKATKPVVKDMPKPLIEPASTPASKPVTVDIHAAEAIANNEKQKAYFKKMRIEVAKIIQLEDEDEIFNKLKYYKGSKKLLELTDNEDALKGLVKTKTEIIEWLDWQIEVYECASSMADFLRFSNETK